MSQTEGATPIRAVPPDDAPMSCLTMSPRAALAGVVVSGFVAVTAGMYVAAVVADPESTAAGAAPMVMVFLVALGTLSVAYLNLRWLLRNGVSFTARIPSNEPERPAPVAPTPARAAAPTRAPASPTFSPVRRSSGEGAARPAAPAAPAAPTAPARPAADLPPRVPVAPAAPFRPVGTPAPNPAFEAPAFEAPAFEAPAPAPAFKAPAPAPAPPVTLTPTRTPEPVALTPAPPVEPQQVEPRPVEPRPVEHPHGDTAPGEPLPSLPVVDPRPAPAVVVPTRTVTEHRVAEPVPAPAPEVQVAPSPEVEPAPEPQPEPQPEAEAEAAPAGARRVLRPQRTGRGTDRSTGPKGAKATEGKSAPKRVAGRPRT